MTVGFLYTSTHEEVWSIWQEDYPCRAWDCPHWTVMLFILLSSFQGPADIPPLDARSPHGVHTGYNKLMVPAGRFERPKTFVVLAYKASPVPGWGTRAIGCGGGNWTSLPWGYGPQMHPLHFTAILLTFSLVLFLAPQLNFHVLPFLGLGHFYRTLLFHLHNNLRLLRTVLTNGNALLSLITFLY